MSSSPHSTKSVLITGGASGIGLAISTHFAAVPSIHLSILDISPAAGATALSSLQAAHPSAIITFHKCDISDWNEQKAVFEKVYREAGAIDVVIANAGVSERGKFLQVEEGEPEKPDFGTLDVNLMGTLYTVKLAVHYMRKNPSPQRGLIICTASNAGIYPFPVAPIYGTSKHAVVGAVRSLARPLEPEGIRINALCPAVIATNLAPPSLFAAMALTPVSTAIKAVVEFVNNPKHSGVTAEISGENFTFREPPEYVDEDSGRNLEVFWALGYS